MIPSRGNLLAYPTSPRPGELFIRFRKSTLPKEGWTHENFLRNKRKLLEDVLAARRLALRINTPKMTKAVEKLLDEEMEAVLTEFAKRVYKEHAKSLGSVTRLVLNLVLPKGAAAIWEAVLGDVFSPAQVSKRVDRHLRPVYQSTLDHVVDKTSVLIDPSLTVSAGEESDESASEDEQSAPRPAYSPPTVTATIRPPRVVREVKNEDIPKLIRGRADKLCKKVTKISGTTRKRMRKFFEEQIEKDATVYDVIKALQKEHPKWKASRVARIVRNELSLAANEAQILSFQNSLSVTHCSVIGCQAIEDDSPTYKGFHTCNIQNVPVRDLEKVEFHIGHTGSWIPTGFRKRDGSVPKLPLGNELPTQRS